MNAESDKLVALRDVYTCRTNACDELRAHAMNSERDELVRVQPLQVFRFDLLGEFQADIVDGHRPLFVAVDPVEPEGPHFLRILPIRQEMKKPRALTVSQKTF